MKILQIKTRGLKNLKKDIVFSFSNVVVGTGIKNIKTINGIYGNNGAGKSAFISSVDLYLKMLRNRKYLFSDNNQDCLRKLINNEIHEFYFEIIFMTEIKNKQNVYKHSLLLKRNSVDETFVLENEFYGVLRGRTINDKYDQIVSFSDRQFSFNEEDLSPVTKCIKEELTNYIGGGSFISSFTYALITVMKREKANFILGFLFPLFMLSLKMDVYLLDDDRHEIPTISNEKAKIISDILNQNKTINKRDFERIIAITHTDKYVDFVTKTQIKKYESNLLYLENFIKIFKPELGKIGYEKKQNGEVLNCRKQFYYNNKPIDVEYESSGIKHLTQLHSSLQGFVSGGIVFIDEMDVNINSVYLAKLVEFLAKYGKGQLCFTTHNLQPMNALNCKNGSISVIGFENNVDVWVKNGNLAPANFYSKGYYDHSPFNVEPFEFLQAFDIKDQQI